MINLVHRSSFMVHGKKRQFINHFGFTLVEILVVITLLAVMGGILTEVFVRTLRTNNKSHIIGIIKQNGQTALETIDKTIRNSEEIVCPTTAGVSNYIIIRRKNEATNADEYFRFRYTAPTSSTNGKITQEFSSTVSDPLDCNNPFTTTPIVQELTDTKTQTGVSVTSSGLFNRNALIANTKDVVNIQFSVGRAVLSPTAIAGQIDPVEFRTTVVLR